MIRLILILLVLGIVALLVYAATRPGSFRIVRSIRIQAPAARIHALINDFGAWAQWSPWEKKDPAMTRTRSGPATGTGSVYGWEGNKQVGKGRMEITESTPPSRVLIQLDFLAPFEAHNMAEFTLQADGDTTEVTWAMYGPSPFMAKLMSVFFSMEKMVGPDFEQGLANLKALAERPPLQDTPGT
jgi:hypothetical protein